MTMYKLHVAANKLTIITQPRALNMAPTNFSVSVMTWNCEKSGISDQDIKYFKD